MSKKSNISTALWFIPLLAVLLAVLFVLIFWTGRVLLHKTSKPVTNRSVSQDSFAQTESTNVPSPIVPTVPVEIEEEEIPVPPEVLDMEELPQETDISAETDASAAPEQPATPEVCPATTMAVKIKKSQRKISYTPYQKGLFECKKNKIFPCAWEDKTASAIKQYWLLGAEGPITRGVYDMNGNLKSETIASINGTVSSHSDQNTTWYFQAGMLVKIRTSPYDNCNFHDWFFINDTGEQDVCQCAYTTADCCARSPYRTGMSRSYCGLFPSDKDFCK